MKKNVTILFDQVFDSKRSLYSCLLKVQGFGRRMARYILKHFSFPNTQVVGELSQDTLAELNSQAFLQSIPSWFMNRPRDFFNDGAQHLVLNDLKVSLINDINRLKSINCYRGVRHSQFLKVRGQRLGTNGRNQPVKHGIA